MAIYNTGLGDSNVSFLEEENYRKKTYGSGAEMQAGGDVYDRQDIYSTIRFHLQVYLILFMIILIIGWKEVAFIVMSSFGEWT